MKKIIYIVIILILIIGMIYYNSKEEYENIKIDDTLLKEETLEKEKIIIHIDGAIQNPGIIELKENIRIADAIEEAGGVTEEADLSKINLAYQLKDGQKIYIPSKNEETKIEIITNDAGKEIIKENMNNNSNLVNINYATQTELETLPGIGPSTAYNIIKYREQNGEFKSIEEIKQVEGIGEVKYEKIKDKIEI